ncbi:hypothetical protein OSB04_008067 [Centaurea solstitialis]|uniref:Pentatricopeptide repeat-containing protein n=1 Tax=Centaurea solstitialis TaxID=347529 RepID=A0AA38WJ49_9ASTR|nr:hypothetical protein OSB04_008067 [Centaurea solstitialis]
MVLLLRACKFADRSLLSNPSFISKFVFNASFFSTKTQTASIQDHDVLLLYKRISLNPRTSIVPILDQWLQEGNEIIVDKLKNMIKVLRNHNRYTHALQLSEWMTNRSLLDQSPGNIAVHLDLVSRVHGLKQAEKIFDTIPDSLKNFKVYGTLLNCYTFKKSLEKAEATMEKMKQLGTTYYLQLTAYASFDINAMEKLLGYMEANPNLTLDWHVYIIAAKGYLKFGQHKKSLEMLKKSEGCVYENTNGVAYEILMTMYANLAEKDEVYRIWDLYRKRWRKINDKGYHHMISSLVKLDDIDGAEKIVAEWESVRRSFCFWVPNVLVNAYGKKGDWEKAESYIERLVGMGKKPPTSTWDILGTMFCKHGEMEKAVGALRKAILSRGDDHWKLNEVTLRECLKYLEEKGDVEVVKEFVEVIDRGILI